MSNKNVRPAPRRGMPLSGVAARAADAAGEARAQQKTARAMTPAPADPTLAPYDFQTDTNIVIG